MSKKVVFAGILGGIALMICTFVVNGIFRFNVNINMKEIAAERIVYETLKENIVEPGRYICNPQLTSEGRFPEGEPVFSILYGGMGHESSGSFMLIGLVVYILTPMIGAWMLSRTSMDFLKSYSKKVMFFIVIGLLIALFTDLMRYGIGDYPLGDVLLLAINHVLTWTVVGLVVGWRIKPEKSTEPN